MRPDFHRNPAVRHRAENFLQHCRIRTDSLLQLDRACFIQHAVPAVAISQIQSNRQFLLRDILALLCPAVLTFFIAGLLYLCASKHVDNLGAYSIPSETGLLIPSDNNNQQLLSRLRIHFGIPFANLENA